MTETLIFDTGPQVEGENELLPYIEGVFLTNVCLLEVNHPLPSLPAFPVHLVAGLADWIAENKAKLTELFTPQLAEDEGIPTLEDFAYELCQETFEIV